LLTEEKKEKTQKQKKPVSAVCCWAVSSCWFLMSEAVAHMLFPFAFLDHHP
jgi:hypothetical protein